MSALKKQLLRQRRKVRIRAKVSGTAKKPRLSVHRSLTKITAQIIDDVKGLTLVAVVSAGRTVADAQKAGEELAKKALEKKIATCVFDRGGFAYHGRVKALAEGARAGGLKF